MGAMGHYVSKKWNDYWYRLACDHGELYVDREGDWIPTFETTNGLDDEDTRTVVYKCSDCAKEFRREERRHGHMTKLLVQADNEISRFELLQDKFNRTERYDRYDIGRNR